MHFPKIGQGMGLYKWEDKHIDIFKEGVDLGLNFFDTAPNYPGSEDLIRKISYGIREKLFIATKFSPEDSSYERVILSLEESLKRLGTDYVDLYQMHWPNPDYPIEETIRAMEKVLKDGKTKEIGLGNVYVNEVKNCVKFLSGSKFSSIQVEYNFFDRTPEYDLIPFCIDNGLTIIAYSPLDRGRFVDGEENLKKISKIAIKYKKTISQINLRWLTQNKPVIAIPKSVDIKHIKENSESVNFIMDEIDIKEINDITKKKINYISPSKINVEECGEYNREVYCTIQEAIENKCNYIPSPVALSKTLNDDIFFKPVRLLREDNNISRYKLIEGRIRYWAWVIARGDEPIPSLIRETKRIIR